MARRFRSLILGVSLILVFIYFIYPGKNGSAEDEIDVCNVYIGYDYTAMTR